MAIKIKKFMSRGKTGIDEVAPAVRLSWEGMDVIFTALYSFGDTGIK